MIFKKALNEWREKMDWQVDSFIEQDLVLGRALIDLYSEPGIAENFALIGGTALHKLHIQPGTRYSEDIDLVRITPGRVGPIFDLMREKLDPWLGQPRYNMKKDGFKFTYRFDSNKNPPTKMRLKIEAKWEPEFKEMDFPRIPFNVENSWFSGRARVTTLPINEILGGKLCALYQRRKGRDVFDLWCAIDRGMGNPSEIVECFERRMAGKGIPVPRSVFEENLRRKMENPKFRAEAGLLLRRGANWNFDEGARVVMEHFLGKIKESRKQMKKRGEYRFKFPNLNNGDKDGPVKPAPRDRGDSR